jgi:hypothetical protein
MYVLVLEVKDYKCLWEDNIKMALYKCGAKMRDRTICVRTGLSVCCYENCNVLSVSMTFWNFLAERISVPRTLVLRSDLFSADECRPFRAEGLSYT